MYPESQVEGEAAVRKPVICDAPLEVLLAADERRLCVFFLILLGFCDYSNCSPRIEHEAEISPVRVAKCAFVVVRVLAVSFGEEGTLAKRPAEEPLRMSSYGF